MNAQMEAMTERIIDEALAEARARGELQALTSRTYRLCDDAVAARRVARLRRSLGRAA